MLAYKKYFHISCKVFDWSTIIEDLNITLAMQQQIYDN